MTSDASGMSSTKGKDNHALPERLTNRVKNKFRHKVRSMPGYDKRNWLRVVQIDSWREFIERNQPIGDVLEISPGWNQMWRSMRSGSYTAVDYPEFDISKDTLERKFDLVITDQVLEHVLDAAQAASNIHAMIKPGGSALIATPFLFRVHARPYDFHRWTEAGLRHLLEEAGFAPGAVETFSWGNKACVRAHVGGPVRDYGFYR